MFLPLIVCLKLFPGPTAQFIKVFKFAQIEISDYTVHGHFFLEFGRIGQPFGKESLIDFLHRLWYIFVGG